MNFMFTNFLLKHQFSFPQHYNLFTGASENDKLALWGNYSIPKDNPVSEDPELRPEIWATGLRNPWRCSFDSENPSYFICADVGQVIYIIHHLQVSYEQFFLLS